MVSLLTHLNFIPFLKLLLLVPFASYKTSKEKLTFFIGLFLKIILYNNPFVLDDQTQQSFDALKRHLNSAPWLVHLTLRGISSCTSLRPPIRSLRSSYKKIIYKMSMSYTMSIGTIMTPCFLFPLRKVGIDYHVLCSKISSLYPYAYNQIYD